jgi:ferredoxin--NADP+ reductase
VSATFDPSEDSLTDAPLSPEDIDSLRRQHCNATVVSLTFAHSDLMILRVRPDHGVSPHKPGQYTTLGLGHWEPRAPGCHEETTHPGDERKLIRRAYSLSSSILDDEGQLLDHPVDWLEFYIVLVRESDSGRPALTPRLFTLKEGDRIFVGEKIVGHFSLDPVQPGDSVVFLSTGTGEAPHNCMLGELLRRKHTGNILAVCCVRYRRDLAYLAIHEELMRRYPNYRYWPLTTREAEDIGNKRYIQDLIVDGRLEERLGAPLDPARTHVMLCGNPNMIGLPNVDRATGLRTYPKPIGVIEILAERGFRLDHPAAKVTGNIHFEEYW